MIHLFDVDYTVIRKPTTWYFLCEALERRAVSFSQIRGLPLEWLRYKMGRANQDFIEQAVAHIAGIERRLLETIAEDCFVRRLRRDIYAGAAKLIGELKSRGERVYFASSSLRTLIAPLERFFGIAESVASELEFAEGKTTGKLSGGGVFGAKKKSRGRGVACGTGIKARGHPLLFGFLHGPSPAGILRPAGSGQPGSHPFAGGEKPGLGNTALQGNPGRGLRPVTATAGHSSGAVSPAPPPVLPWSLPALPGTIYGLACNGAASKGEAR